MPRHEWKLFTGNTTVGLFVLVTAGAACVNVPVAASSKVRVTFVTITCPPTCAMISVLYPAGDTTSASTSDGEACHSLFSVTVDFTSEPPTPLTLMIEG